MSIKIKERLKNNKIKALITCILVISSFEGVLWIMEINDGVVIHVYI